MIGIILTSHGTMAEGMLNSAKLFFGDDIPKVETVCLQKDDDPEALDGRLNDCIAKLDDGSGVLILADLFGGTPANRSAILLSNPANTAKLKVITGMNLTMFLEFLGLRQSMNSIEYLNTDVLIKAGCDGIICLNSLL